MKRSFSERMQDGKDAAANARYRGNHVGTVAQGWRVVKPKLEGLDAIEAYYHQWRKDIHINAYCAVEWALFGDDWQDLCEF